MTAPEIERKFLVRDVSVIHGRPGITIRQTYLIDDGKTVLRLGERDGRHLLTLREAAAGVVRRQFTVEVPEHFGTALAASPLARAAVKRRYQLEHDGHGWTVDVWVWPRDDLAVAEIELSDPGETFTVPPWCGREVTGEPGYYDHMIARPARGGAHR